MVLINLQTPEIFAFMEIHFWLITDTLINKLKSEMEVSSQVDDEGELQ